MKESVLLLALFFPVISYSLQADVEPCFTPGQRCDLRIINAINNAQRTIEVQAYQLTSAPISSALSGANRRGVRVQIILDKSQYRNKGYSAAIYFMNQHIPVWIDLKPAIAHNKVIIIDDDIVITGSYNFSNAAQFRNAENVLIIKSDGVAKAYDDNYNKRLKISVPISEYSAAR